MVRFIRLFLYGSSELIDYRNWLEWQVVHYLKLTICAQASSTEYNSQLIDFLIKMLNSNVVKTNFQFKRIQFFFFLNFKFNLF